MAKSTAQPKDTAKTTERQARAAALMTQYGDIKRKTEAKPVDHNGCLRSPSPSFNVATNERGLRPGSVAEVYGLEGTAKTTFHLQLAAQAQRQFPEQSVAIIDPEYAVDLYQAQAYGVDVTGIVPDTGMPRLVFYPDPALDAIPDMEEMLNRIYNFAESGLFSLIILDSIAAAITAYEAKEEDVTTGQFAGPAPLLSKALKKIKAVCAKTGTRLVCINQLRTKIIATPRGAITKEEPGGGMAMRFAATHRVRVAWDGSYRSMSGKECGKLKMFFEKVKYGQPYAEIVVPFVFGEGFDKYEDLVTVAEQAGIFQKNGTWYSFNGTRLGQGAAQVGEYLRSNPVLAADIEEASYDKLCPQPLLASVQTDETEASVEGE